MCLLLFSLDRNKQKIVNFNTIIKWELRHWTYGPHWKFVMLLNEKMCDFHGFPFHIYTTLTATTTTTMTTNNKKGILKLFSSTSDALSQHIDNKPVAFLYTRIATIAIKWNDSFYMIFFLSLFFPFHIYEFGLWMHLEQNANRMIKTNKTKNV